MGLINRLLTGKKSTAQDEIRNEIIENISHLINAKAPIWSEKNLSPILSRSIVNYGINNPARSQGKYNGGVIIKEIEQLLEYFEPRFSWVQVALAEDAYKEKLLRFIIKAGLKGHNDRHFITLDSQLDFSASQMEVIDYYEE
ncbi:type VI secretion system baseplate subunit TssE [Moellerella wisconsensis]|uniref:type VI secretion system baseplate subunit TssE n=1 Tax=Moellerella wisconsensis TaxID=158849 RepID=UPI0025B1F178|nr:type VI secretion system baseplate subunit TssE [Moellerella wisconsensis]WJW81005.1 type VI secretion system baseplate subunit TssE [Moellerella wisconsensis]